MKVLYFFAVLCLVGFVCAGDDEAVITVTSENFAEVVQTAPIILVEFYAPWCGHCKHLAPEYEKAAQILKAEGIPLAKVDATEDGDLASRYEVTGYPTLLVFKNGKPSDYEGTREANGIVSYMRKKAGPASRKLYTQVDIDNLKSREVSVISFDEATPEFLAAADGNDFAAFGEVTDESLRGDNAGKIVLYRESDSREFVYESGDLDAWVRSNSIPVAGEMTQTNFEEYTSAGVPRLVAFIDVDWEKNVKRTNYFKRRMMKVGSEFEGRVIFALADKEVFLSDPSGYGIEGEEVGEYVIAIENGPEKYLFSEVFDKFNVANLREFTEKFLNGELESYLKSEPVPADNDGGVTVVVGKTFDDIVFDHSKNVLIEFYAPWCGHCKTLEPKYYKLGEAFANNDKVIIAKIDATANDWNKEAFNVRGFPTIYFKPAGADSDIVQYNGEREVSGFKKFIKQNGVF